MSVATGATLMGRKQSESLMQSTCTIRRPNGTTVNGSGVEVPAWTVIYDSGKGDGLGGKCRLRFPFVRPQQALVAGQQLSKERGILSLPIVGSEGVRTDDVATINTNPLDVGSVGLTFRIEGPFSETHATARRLAVEVIS
jgi:hypothetical protein